MCVVHVFVCVRMSGPHNPIGAYILPSTTPLLTLVDTRVLHRILVRKVGGRPEERKGGNECAGKERAQQTGSESRGERCDELVLKSFRSNQNWFFYCCPRCYIRATCSARACATLRNKSTYTSVGTAVLLARQRMANSLRLW